MFKIVLKVNADALEVSYGLHSMRHKALNAYSSALSQLVGEHYGASEKYADGMTNAINATVFECGRYGEDAEPWTVTTRFEGGYVRLTGNL